MKKITCILLALILSVFSFASALPVSAQEVLPTLSELSDSQLLAFLEDNNISVPAEFADDADLADWVRSNIATFEINPHMPAAYNYTVSFNFMEQIRGAVNAYYGVSASSQTASQSSARALPEDSLQQNRLYDTWQIAYDYTNCYGFAMRDLGMFIDPGYYYEESTGNSLSFNLSMPLAQMAACVEQDLETLGYEARSTYTKPTTLAYNEHMVCIRKERDSKDYHMMRYSTSQWEHKFGVLLPLIFDANMNYNVAWIREGIWSEYMYDDSVLYNGMICYIIYVDPEAG